MKAIIKKSFRTVFIYDESDNSIELDSFDEDCIGKFEKGDTVEILKVVDAEDYEGGKAYVIYNPKNHECVTIYGGAFEIIEE